MILSLFGLTNVNYGWLLDLILFFYRYSSHLPMGGPHRNIKDVTLGGYKVPKDTFVSEHNNRYYLF